MAEDDMDKDKIIGDDKPKKDKIEENEKSELKGNNFVDDESETVDSSESESTKKKSSHKEFNKATSNYDKSDKNKHVDDMTLNSDDEDFEDYASKDEDLKNDDDSNKIESEEIEDKGKIRSIKNLSGLFERWFVDYASYVILERAVPYIEDGLKPVQRRILHSMKELDDGRYNKVANIIGNTMKYHPHGDASIGDALVQLGQKDLLIDCQGN